MKIETKYSIGDEVWVYCDGRPKKIKIDYINVYINSETKLIKYSGFYEDYLFPTKEKLLESL